MCSETDLDLSDGDALLHTDFNSLNILLPDRVWIIDWAWPTRGASLIDAACFLIRAMAAGHSASQAEALAARCPGWQQAPSAAIDVFATATARLYDEIAATALSPSSNAWLQSPCLGPPPLRAAVFIGLGGNLEADAAMPAVRTTATAWKWSATYPGWWRCATPRSPAGRG